MTNKTSWIDRKIERCKGLKELSLLYGLHEQSASLPVAQYQALFEALKAARVSIQEMIDDLALLAEIKQDECLDISQGVLHRAYETIKQIDALGE